MNFTTCIRILTGFFLFFLSVDCFAQQYSTTQIPTLPDDFTLTYDVTGTPSASEKLIQKQFERQKQQFEQQVARGEMKQEELDKILPTLRFPYSAKNPPEHYQIVLSSQKGKLFFQKRMLDTSKNIISERNALFNGKDTYTIYLDKEQEKNIHDLTVAHDPNLNRLIIQKGFELREVLDFPIPGVNMTHLPLMQQVTKTDIQNNQVTFTGTSLNFPIYTRAGSLSFSPATLVCDNIHGGLKPTQLTLYYPDNTQKFQWNFSGETQCGSIVVPTNISVQRYEIREKDSDPQNREIIYKYNFILQKAETTPLETKSFDPITWVKKGHIIQDSRGAESVAYEYNGKTKSLEQTDQKTQPNTPSQQPQYAVSGVILGVAFVLLGLIFVVRRYRKMTQQK